MTAAETWVVVVPPLRQTELVSAELVGEARRLAGNGSVHVLLVGNDLRAAGQALAKWGISSCLLIEDERLSSYQPERFARLIASAVAKHDPTVVLFAGTVLGADLGARVGTELDRRFHGQCLNFELSNGGIRVTRAVSGGRQHQIEFADGAPFLLSLVPGTVGPGASSPSKTMLFTDLGLERDIDLDRECFRDLGFVAADPRTMDILDADVIVAGGRGVGGPVGFELLEEVAEQLEASLGASRPAVEAGWAPYERLVGQTGRTVHPKLYLACGISGAPQHLAGMREAETIIAINTDPNAPIFGVATLGVVADLHDVLSALVSRLRTRHKGVA
jgi:electron transfer flavoprotein alpha subunit